MFNRPQNGWVELAIDTMMILIIVNLIGALGFVDLAAIYLIFTRILFS